jgi:peroxiredoxin
MATSSTDSMAPGTPAPAFTLPDVVTGRMRSLDELAGPAGTLVIFLCAHCPYVVHVRAKLAELAEKYFPLGISTLGISSNDAVAYPEDSPEKLREMVEESGLPFPVLFDAKRRLAYRGRLDASSPRNGQPLTGEDLENALSAVTDAYPVPQPWPSALGCSIKWKS